MTIHDARLTFREPVAEGTLAFHFDKPPGFLFKPGQAVDIILPDPSLAESPDGRHTFSLVSAPFQEELVIATRMRDSAFKRTLGSLPVGSAVRVEGPFGSLTLHKDRARPAVFIAGGIGITPFMSMLRQAASDRSRQRLTLLYSNRRPEEAAFLAELRELQALNLNFRLMATMTDLGESAGRWAGETRRIDEQVVKHYSGDVAASTFYVAGPPAMVAALQQALNRAGIDDDAIRSEAFAGY